MRQVISSPSVWTAEDELTVPGRVLPTAGEQRRFDRPNQALGPIKSASRTLLASLRNSRTGRPTTQLLDKSTSSAKAWLA